ncbi:MAG: sulfatase, partial [Candidatus Hydrogenedentota bacterium]
GKWHLDGHGRRSYIPEDRRQGFDYWKVLECSHAYNDSYFYEDDDPKVHKWEEYDAFAQTLDAQAYIRERAEGDEPFALFLSWGPPHNPYQSAPQVFRDMFKAEDIVLRPNVTDAGKRTVAKLREDLAGYYAHIAALDVSIGNLMKTLEDLGIAENTIVVFTSDHGDMIGSQGQQRKQRPWDESIRIPFLIRYPGAHGSAGREVPTVLNSPDIMPTLLGLAGVDAPDSVEGRDFAALVRGGDVPNGSSALIACISPFGEWTQRNEGKEYRGVRTERYTYVRDLEGPWLLYDNLTDPYQLANLVGVEQHSELQARLEGELTKLLAARSDEFLRGEEYIERWGYAVNETGTVVYTNEIPAGALE